MPCRRLAVRARGYGGRSCGWEEGALDVADLVRLDYEQTTQLVRTLTEIRFRLLAFVPTIAGAAVALLADASDPARLLAVGLLGLVATLGIYLYELRNTQLYDAALGRAQALERRLAIPAFPDDGVGGVFAAAPREPVRLFGRIAARHRRGLALVYGAALAGWGYLVGWGAFALVEVPGARSAGSVVGIAVGVLAAAQVDRRG